MTRFPSALMLFITLTTTTVGSAQSCRNGLCQSNPEALTGYQDRTSSYADDYRYQNQYDYQNDNYLADTYQDRYRIPARLPAANCADGTCQVNGRCAFGLCDRQDNLTHYRDTNRLPLRDQYRSDDFAAPLPAYRPILTNYRDFGTSGRDLFENTSLTNVNNDNRNQRLFGNSRTGFVNWQSDFTTASRYAQQVRQPMLVSVTADWCTYCRHMKSDTFTNRQVILNAERFIPISLNADTNRELISRMGIKSLPTTLVISPDFRIVDRLEGFRTADEVSRVLQRHLPRVQLDTRTKVAVR